MKRILIIVLVFCTLVGSAQMKEEKIRQEYQFEKENAANVFQLANIFGSIEVIVHKEQKIVLEARKIINAKTIERLDLGIKETGISLLDRYDTLIVFAASPCHEFKKRDSKIGYAYNWNNCQLKYDYKFDMKLFVPAKTNLVLSTVNDGDIKVTGVKGDIMVRNVNGAIQLENVEGRVEAHTINGDLDVNYGINPTKDSRYYTLNGDIHAFFNSGLAAKISFKSFNGDMYTNLPSLVSLRGDLSVKKLEEGGGIKFKIDDRRMLQTRNGNVVLDFETFNGDAYIKEK